jgi:hypothetical protein
MNIHTSKAYGGPKILHISIKQCQLVFPRAEISKAVIAELNQMFSKQVWKAMTREAVKVGYKDGSIKKHYHLFPFP